MQRTSMARASQNGAAEAWGPDPLVGVLLLSAAVPTDPVDKVAGDEDRHQQPDESGAASASLPEHVDPLG
jgi:hypothetical protein